MLGHRMVDAASRRGVIAFTGTRRELPGPQRDALREELVRRKAAGCHTLLHGDCVGADAAAHELATELMIEVHIFPPDKGGLRAMCRGAAHTHEPRAYLVRNRLMVDRAEILIACPFGGESSRSGVWATVRYARKKNLLIVCVAPDGAVTVDR